MGYVGRDVDSIVRDLVDVTVKMMRVEAMDKVRRSAQDAAEDRILVSCCRRRGVGFTAGAEPSRLRMARRVMRSANYAGAISTNKKSRSR